MSQLSRSQPPTKTVSDEEVFQRKRLGKNPRDLTAWYKLIRALLTQGNYFEVRVMCGELLTRRPNSFDADRIALVALFKCSFMDLAYEAVLRLAPFLAKLDMDEREALSEVCLFYRHREDCPIRHPKELGIEREFDDFNWSEDRKFTTVETLCLIPHSFHYAIQKNIGIELAARGINCIFTQHVETALWARPKVIVISEALYDSLQRIRAAIPGCKLVNTRHGLGDKNHAALGASQSDYICVSSPYVGELFVRDYLVPEEKICVTGFSLMDDLFRSMDVAGQSASQNSVLLAPTFNVGLGAAHLLRSNPVKSIRGNDDNLVVHIRPHPHFIRGYPEVIADWVRRVRADRNVFLHLSDWTNIVDLFNRSSVMISDISSAGLAWLATGKPLICLVDRKAARGSERYAPEGIEWVTHEAADVVSDLSRLPEAVNSALKNPELRRTERELWRHRLFGELQDGLASSRIADKVISLLQGPTS